MQKVSLLKLYPKRSRGTYAVVLGKTGGAGSRRICGKHLKRKTEFLISNLPCIIRLITLEKPEKVLWPLQLLICMAISVWPHFFYLIANHFSRHKTGQSSTSKNTVKFRFSKGELVRKIGEFKKSRLEMWFWLRPVGQTPHFTWAEPNS